MPSRYNRAACSFALCSFAICSFAICFWCHLSTYIPSVCLVPPVVKLVALHNAQVGHLTQTYSLTSQTTNNSAKSPYYSCLHMRSETICWLRRTKAIVTGSQKAGQLFILRSNHSYIDSYTSTVNSLVAFTLVTVFYTACILIPMTFSTNIHILLLPDTLRSIRILVRQYLTFILW